MTRRSQRARAVEAMVPVVLLRLAATARARAVEAVPDPSATYSVTTAGARAVEGLRGPGLLVIENGGALVDGTVPRRLAGQVSGGIDYLAVGYV